jgi:hypothetical protein
MRAGVLVARIAAAVAEKACERLLAAALECFIEDV